MSEDEQCTVGCLNLRSNSLSVSFLSVLKPLIDSIFEPREVTMLLPSSISFSLTFFAKKKRNNE